MVTSVIEIIESFITYKILSGVVAVPIPSIRIPKGYNRMIRLANWIRLSASCYKSLFTSLSFRRLNPPVQH